MEKKSIKALNFLYKTAVGNIILLGLTRRIVSKFTSIYVNSGYSRKLIEPFIKNNNIDITEYEEKDYKNFNDFFARKIKDGKRPYSNNKKDLIAAADSKLLYYKISDDLKVKIKNYVYTIEELIDDADLAQEYKNGICLVFRLDVDDYHRYIFIDDGKVIAKKTIKGVLHSVKLVALQKYKVFKQNQREYDILETENFGKIIQMEVGALLIGKIKNHDVKQFQRGQEKGYFLYGGSTIVILIKEGIAEIKQDIIDKSLKDIETKVKQGETITKRGD